MKFLTTFLIAFGIAGFLASCASQTPAGRIERNPQIYESLSPKHQGEVRDGRLSRGMPHDAVLLAWGRPTQRMEIMRAEGPAMRWDYVGTRAISHSNLHGSYGRRYWGPHRRCSESAFALGPEITYVPYLRASVWFVDDKVDAWESLK